MALIDQYNLAYSGNLPRRVCAQAWASAMNIVNEDPATADHAARLLWAEAVLLEDVNGPMVRKLTMNCAQNATIASKGESAPDSDIEYVVNSRIAHYADGVYGA